MPDVARHPGQRCRCNRPRRAVPPAHWEGRAPAANTRAERVHRSRGVAADDDVLVVVRKNLRLDEVTGAEQLMARVSAPRRARARGNVSGPLFLPGRHPCGQLLVHPQPRNPTPGQNAAHALSPKGCASRRRRIARAGTYRRMPSLDRELRVIDRLLRNLEP